MKPAFRAQHAFLLWLSLSVVTGVLAQDETVNGNLKVLGKTLELNGRRTHVLNYLSGNTPNPSTDSYRYEVARLCVNTYHWQQTGPIEVELRQAYWGASGYLRFVITAGYGEPSGSVTLVEKFGSALYANISLGAPVSTGTSVGGYPNQYIPVYVDLGNYTYWHVQLTHGWTEATDDIPTTAGRLKFFASPAATVLSGYVAAPGGDARLESRELFAGKIGVGTTSPGFDLEVSQNRAGGVVDMRVINTNTANSASGSRIIAGVGNANSGDPRFVLSVTGTAEYALGIDNSDADKFKISSGSDPSAGANFLTIDTSGSVGIGTTSPDLGAKVHVAGGILTSAAFSSTTGGTGGIDYIGGGVRLFSVGSGGATKGTYIFVAKGADGSSATPMLIDSYGNVGIGTTNPSHKLAVNGTVRAKEVIVDTGWSDYVFKPGYRLASLAEVEAHIREKKHLPGIPSAAEVEAGGVSLGDMQAKLLAKVEELTLHVIAQEKQMKAMQAAHETEIAALRQQLSALHHNP